jgi:hypothetical protein
MTPEAERGELGWFCHGGGSHITDGVVIKIEGADIQAWVCTG